MNSTVTLQESRIAAPANQWRGEFSLGGVAKQISAGRNADGRLEIFYIGADNVIYHNWQTQPNGLFWSGEMRLSSQCAREIAVAPNADGRLALFFIGDDDTLFHIGQTIASGVSWSAATSFSCSGIQQVAIGCNADGRLEVFYTGSDDGLYHNWQTAPNGAWAGETRFPGVSAKQIATGQNADGRLEVFYIAPGGALCYMWQTTPGSSRWSDEATLPGRSARQVVAGQNADGRLEVFYAGSDDGLYHNWQTEPNGSWAGEASFPGESARQIAVARNWDGRLELFYVDAHNTLHHNWQTTPNGVWSGEMVFSGDRARQVAVGQNADGRLEIFYLDVNGGICHNWQVPEKWNLGSNCNYIFSSGCNPLLGLIVTIQVTQDIVCEYASGPTKGFSFQVNACSPKGRKSAWQQYLIALFGNELTGAVSNWPSCGRYLVNDFFHMACLPHGRIPAGYQLKIALQNDTAGNVTGAAYKVIDDNGQTLASVTKMLEEAAPVVAFEFNLVGPVNSDSAVLSSGAGSISYQATTPLTATRTGPVCAESGYITAETANSIYGSLPSGPSSAFSQSFSIGNTEGFLVRKQGKVRPGLIIPNRQD